jgi:nicotinamide riboside transporter PnuC
MVTPAQVNTIVSSEYTKIYGYYPYAQSDSENNTKNKHMINIPNALSYIPIIRRIVGVWRIYTHIFTVTNPQATAVQKKVAYSSIARGVAEVLLPDIAVVLLLAADIGMTILRNSPRVA